MGSGRDAIWEAAGMYRPMTSANSPAVRILQNALHEMRVKLDRERRTLPDYKLDELLQSITDIQTAIRRLT